MGASPYKRRSELLAEKMSEPVVQEETAVFRRGNLLEPVLLQEAATILGVEVFTPHVIYRDNRLSVSLDGVDDWESPSMIVEAKTTTKYSVHDSSDLPQEWLWQGWAQQAVVGVPVWFAVLDRDLRISCVQMPENKAAVDSLRTEIEIFGRWVDERVLPAEEIDNFTAEDIARIVKPQPTSIELGLEAIDWVEALDEARAMIRSGEQLEKHAKDWLAQRMLENEMATVNGVPLVSWKQQAGRKSLDTKRLREDHPALVAEYEREGQPFRTMRVLKGAK
jgi:predicted phage-related endonuclease